MSDATRPGIPDSLEHAVGFNLYRVALLFRRELMVALAEYELTPEQWQVLAALWATLEPVHQQQLCALTLKDKHALSRMLVRMERDGWVSRQRDGKDRRAVWVRPTAKATALREQIPARLYAHFTPILAVLAAEETTQLLRHLKTLRTHLEAREHSP